MAELKASVRRSRRTHQQIADVLADFSKAGLTVKEFCELHQISRGTFHKWQSKLKAKKNRLAVRLRSDACDAKKSGLKRMKSGKARLIQTKMLERKILIQN